MTIHLLNCGTLRPPGGGAVPTQCLLLEHADGLLAVDAGLSRAHLQDPRGLSVERFFINPPREPGLALINQIRRLGFDPRDLTDIVLTHLHSEHASGIMDFPRARIHVSRREYDSAMDGSINARLRYRHNVWAHGPHWELHDGTDTWKGIESVSTIGSDILLLPTPGHTLGNCGVAVKNPDGNWLLHAGDAAYSDLNNPSTRPIFPLRQFEWASAVDRVQLCATHDLLRELGNQPDVQVMCAHQPVEIAGTAVTLNPQQSQPVTQKTTF